MINQFLFLQYLLFIDPTIGLTLDRTTPHSMIFKSGTEIPSLNRVCNSATPTSQELIDIVSYFKRTPFTWTVSKEDQATIKVLSDNSMIYRASETAMILDLSNIKASSHDLNITIKEIDPYGSEINPWLDIVAKSLKTTQAELLPFFKKLQDCAHHIKFYQGYYQKIPTSTCLIIEHDQKTISVHWVSTLSEYQRKGLGNAIMTTALCNAQKTGYKQAILLSTDQGKKLYEHMGFQEYGQYAIYSNGSFYLIFRSILKGIYQALGFKQISSVTKN